MRVGPSPAGTMPAPAKPKKTLEQYTEALPPEQQKIVGALIALVRETAPDATGSVKWAQPVFEQNGPFCYIRAYRDHVNFGFWRGAEMVSGRGSLEGAGDRMAHVKLARAAEIRRPLFQKWIREAVELNAVKGDPTHRG